MYNYDLLCSYHCSALITIHYQYVPHKTVAEVSKIGNLWRLVAVNDGSQGEPTDGPTSGWRQHSVVEVVVVIAVEM